jgi:hypothetical protein
MTTINTGLNKKVIQNTDLAVVLYLENKFALQDDDKRIKRRKYVYQARKWEVL